MDSTIKYLNDNLKYKDMTVLDLRKHDIGREAGEHLNQILINDDLMPLNLVINDTEEGDVINCMSLRSHLGIYKIDVTLHTNKIGNNVAQFLNKTFQNITIAKVVLDKKQLDQDDAEYLAEAFKDIKIGELKLSHDHMNLTNEKYLVQALLGSQIATLNLYGENIGLTGASSLSLILSKIDFLHLNLSRNSLCAEGIKRFANEIRFNKIMYIDVSWNDLRDEGAECLAKYLGHSKTVDLNLCYNNISTFGAKHLAKGILFSQVTRIYLSGNYFGIQGYKYFTGLIEDSNIPPNDLLRCCEEDESSLWLYVSRKDDIDTINESHLAFKQLVSLNPVANEYEFIVPGVNANISIEQYVFLIKTLNDNKYYKLHIFDKICNNDPFDFNTMDKINEFITNMPKKFNMFIDNNLPAIVERWSSCNFVDLVKEFQKFKLNDIVQHLLLHRILYFVDENEEILHPYIYKMLHKYNMPLYNEQIEPNKKEEIISYYQNHREIQGAQEIIYLLRSESFN